MGGWVHLSVAHTRPQQTRGGLALLSVVAPLSTVPQAAAVQTRESCMHFGGNTILDINTDPTCSRTTDPDMGLGCSLGHYLTVASSRLPVPHHH